MKHNQQFSTFASTLSKSIIIRTLIVLTLLIIIIFAVMAGVVQYLYENPGVANPNIILVQYGIDCLIVEAIGFFILYLIIRYDIKHKTQLITELTYSTMNMSRGNFHASFPDTSAANGEIQQLATSMHYLQNTINDYITLLKTATAEQERIESELAIAKEIQLGFLPKEFKADNFCECYGVSIPAKEVGGDLFGMRRIGDEIFFVIGDVSGKGVPAAIYMAITQSAFNFFCRTDMTTSAIMSNINDVFSENNKDGMFVTVFMGKIDVKTLEMEFCYGGHCPVILMQPDGQTQFLHAETNMAVGLFQGFPFVSDKIQLQKGSRIITYTDGVIEAENPVKELYDNDRLMEFASQVDKKASSKQVTDQLVKSVQQFADGNEQNDDITIFTLKIND